jgi:tetratricopeptide (TPR) repeat protein
LNPHDFLALWKLGELTLRTNAQEARGYLEHAVQFNPELPQAVLAYGRALARVGEKRRLSSSFVVRLAPEEDSVHYHLADASRRVGRNDDAKAEMARFEELARKKSARTQAEGREMIDLSRSAPASTDGSAPGFSPEHDPTHQ